MKISRPTPKDLGYRFPAEFEPHAATWLSWPHKEATWPGKIESIYSSYCLFIKALSEQEEVHINVLHESMKAIAAEKLKAVSANMERVRFFMHPTNDAWCRDHGPAFLVNPAAAQPKIVIDWNYNAWGNKYPPFDLDDRIPTLVANAYRIPVLYPEIIMEGGSVDFNGKGTLITSESCLLNKNRNPHLDRSGIEAYLEAYYCVDQVLWIKEGIVGDDTDGHIDDTVRFINEDSVLAVVEENQSDDNYEILQRNLADLKTMRLLNGKQLNVIELPMPDKIVYEDLRLPASYANFYIANGLVVVPTFRCDQDDRALRIIQDAFPERKVTGIDSTDIIWGLGSFHCLSQQEPAV
ncbi:MAG TPA: agmatine deiminase [Chitinophagaceae bacterium]|jgi:agmatine deiminase|nr:agmatine deiminase [Chitinophagaceae bacterium]